jgi:hypothetical protein
MKPESDDAVAFRAGMARVLSTLTDAIDDATATTIIRFSLLAVDIYVERLKILIITIYNSTTLSSKCIAKLLLKLLELTPPYLEANVTRPSGEAILLAGFELTRWLLLQECQLDFEATITKAVWSPKPIIVTNAMFQAGHTKSGIVVEHIMNGMADSEHLFVYQNFELFIDTCFSCGLQLDALGCKTDQLTAVINKASARVAAESNMFKCVMIGLVDARDNGWITKKNTASPVSPEAESATPETESPPVLTPETDSLTELEVGVQRELLFLSSRALEV